MSNITLGVQEPPADPMIYNRRQPDGTFRSIRGFFIRPRDDWRTGWHIHRLGGMTCDCANDAQLVGWQARRDSENWALLVADALKLEVSA